MRAVQRQVTLETAQTMQTQQLGRSHMGRWWSGSYATLPLPGSDVGKDGGRVSSHEPEPPLGRADDDDSLSSQHWASRRASLQIRELAGCCRFLAIGFKIS